MPRLLPMPPAAPALLQVPLLSPPDEGEQQPSDSSAGFIDRSRLTAGAVHVVFGEGGGALRDSVGRFAGLLARHRGRTPSLVADLDSGMESEQASQAQRLRAELRRIDAELVSVRAQMVRGALLQGPSGRRRTCDEACTGSGCGEEFAEEDGVLCSDADCGLFLCSPCFGQLVVVRECQVGGRYDKQVGTTSPAGSLPCPSFPQGCTCGHISLGKIQRALLHPACRGSDGDKEDLDSVGLSPHKVHLVARRRWAEAQHQLAQAAVGAEEGGDGFTLIRTYTEKASTQPEENEGAPLARTFSGVRSLLEAKLNELEELKQELSMRPDTLAAVPVADRRSCLSCYAEFALFEGSECGEGTPFCNRKPLPAVVLLVVYTPACAPALSWLRHWRCMVSQRMAPALASCALSAGVSLVLSLCSANEPILQGGQREYSREYSPVELGRELALRSSYGRCRCLHPPLMRRGGHVRARAPGRRASFASKGASCHLRPRLPALPVLLRPCGAAACRPDQAGDELPMWLCAAVSHRVGATGPA